ncbi:pseudouridine synthase [uncultured Nevskia sp.]|uniref:pseudouridine synthase n=1 Tax=uncultured Nevskia sp. TaxID=228950 RepID=UPI0025E864F3|nr:pseudouridine synthase [uncultured Nevskia sp.]
MIAPEAPARPPSIAGVGASSIRLPPGAWTLLLDFLDQRFPDVGRAVWQARLAEGKVSDSESGRLSPDAVFVAGRLIHYYRELPPEPPIPFAASILHQDEQLLIADKPHFLPTIPSGRFVQETLLSRLRRDTGIEHLVPLHRLDRGTAGLVLFSVNPQTRGVYSALFAGRKIVKTYEALAPLRPALQFPLRRCSRIVAGEPFFRQREVDGEPNAETLIEVIEQRGDLSLYRLQPVTGRKHQLRVQMAALGISIVNDDWYPTLQVEAGAVDNYARPLKLLARRLAFTDPISGMPRQFDSVRDL